MGSKERGTDRDVDWSALALRSRSNPSLAARAKPGVQRHPVTDPAPAAPMPAAISPDGRPFWWDGRRWTGSQLSFSLRSGPDVAAPD